MKVKLYIRQANDLTRRPIGDVDLATDDPIEIARRWTVVGANGDPHGVNDDELAGQLFDEGEGGSGAGFELIYGLND